MEETRNMKQRNKLYSQTEIADNLGISKGNLSKWIRKNNVSPIKIVGNKNLFDETIFIKYRETRKGNKKKENKGFSTIEFLKEELIRKQKEIEELKRRNRELEEQLMNQSTEVIDLAHNLTTLTDQAQKLNLADKKGISAPKKDISENVSKQGKETSVKKGLFSKIFGK